MSMVFCHGCGREIHHTAVACPNCGAAQAVRSGASSKSRVAAALLAFFLGGVGVHKFYLGQIGLGVVYLIFFWTLIPSIVALIEFIILLCMSDEAFAAKYCK
ncbi:MAG: TM2 domain-containing protein [Holophagaceae bacterium]|nr:TM2 domain-containing protein [Holophagaceae bacterium]